MSLPLPDEGERFAAFALQCAQGLRKFKSRRPGVEGHSFEAALAEAPQAREIGLRTLEQLRRNDAWVLLPGDPGWPRLFDAAVPPVGPVFIRGELDRLRPAVAIVGSRHATPYGLSFATDLAAALADGFTIVSGGALGIDGAAHRGALATGHTTVVLGGSLDRLYPRQHSRLFAEILEKGGALVSEAPFGTPAHRGLFPRRNRIIAGLCQAVVVVQAAKRSGSLITARLAREFGIPVLAVPGAPGDAVSEGTKELLKAGAGMCFGPEEVMAALGLIPPKADVRAPRAFARADAGEVTLGRLGRHVGVSPRAIDDLAAAAGLSPQRAAVAMTRMEILGVVARSPGGGFFRLMSSRRQHAAELEPLGSSQGSPQGSEDRS
jgi:DNA processing protein